MVKISVLFIDGINDYSAIKKINRVNPINYEFLLFASSFDQNKTFIKYIDNRDNRRYEESIIEIISDLNPDYIFILSNGQNHKSILRMNLDRISNNIYILANQTNLVNLFYKYDLNIISYNREISLQSQILIKELEGYINDNCLINLDLIDISNKSATITTGYFDIDYPDNIIYRKIDFIKKDVEKILQTGKKYIHINNFNLVNDLKHIENVREIFLEFRSSYKFVWSLIGHPKQLNNLTISDYQSLNNSGLERIEISLFHNSKSLSNIDVIVNSYNDIISVIKKNSQTSITSISLRIVIGSEEETIESKNNLKKFMKEVHSIAMGKVEFEIDYYSTTKSKTPIDSLCLINTQIEPFARKNSPLYYLILKHREEIEKYDLILISESIKKMSAQDRNSHLKLLEKGIITKYTYYFLFKSTTYDLFSLKKSNMHHKYSWEIKDDFFEYSPIIVGRYNISDNGLAFFRFDRSISTEQDIYLELNPNLLYLVNITKERMTLQEIIHLCDKNLSISKEEVMLFYCKLEEKDMLFYTKIFK